MRIFERRSFVMILVICFLAIIMLVAWAIVNIGCGEILQSRARNDYVSANYIAAAGAERLYAILRTTGTIIWPFPPDEGAIQQDGTNVGSYEAEADIISGTRFLIESAGTVNGHTANVIVRYGYDSSFTGGVPIGSLGDIILNGATNPSKIKADGPAVSNGDITVTGKVDIADGTYPNSNPPLATPTFWCDADRNPKLEYDTNNDTSRITDTNGDGSVTLADIPAEGQPGHDEQHAIFTADDVYPYGAPDGVINEEDAFFQYYTHDLDEKYDLDIAPGETYYYSSDQSFDQGDIPNDVRAVFVDGSVDIEHNDQDWTAGGDLNHLVAATGNVNIEQPTNKPGDLLTISAYGNVATDGRMGDKGGVTGDFIIYANGNVTATHGGKMNASIFAKGTLTIDTVEGPGMNHRMVFKSTINWSDMADWPIGLPRNYAVISTGFTILHEAQDKSIWQRV